MRSASYSKLMHETAKLALPAAISILAAGIVLTALMRYFDPLHWGLWIAPEMLLLGRVADPGQAHEVLGDRIYTIAALVVLIAGLAAQESPRPTHGDSAIPPGSTNTLFKQ